MATNGQPKSFAFVGYLVKLDEVIFLIFFIIGIGFLYIGILVNNKTPDFSSWAIGLGFLCWATLSYFAQVLGIIMVLWGLTHSLEPDFLDSLKESYHSFVHHYLETIVDLSQAQDHAQKVELATNAFTAFVKHIEEKKHVRLDLSSQEIDNYVQEALTMIKSNSTGGITG